MTVSALPQSPSTCVLQPGEILTATCDVISSGRIGRLADSNGARVPDVPISFAALAAGKTLTFGPYAQQTRHLIEAMVGTVAWSQAPGTGSHVEIVGDANDVREIFGSGAPVDYTDGTPPATGETVAGPGSRYTDLTGAKIYLNIGTKAQPIWKQLAFVV